jgi:hypothetical protein
MRRLGRALIAGLVLCAAGPAPSAAFTLRHGAHDPVVSGDALYYGTGREDWTEIRRVPLTGGPSRVIYRAPRPYGIDRLRGGGGRLAVGLAAGAWRPRLRSRIVTLDLAGARPTTVASARLRGTRLCGSTLQVADVSPEGEVLVAEGRPGCRRGQRDRTRILLHADGRAREVARYRGVAVNDEHGWRLVSGRLLRTTELAARISDLATGTNRLIRPRGSRRGFVAGDLDPAGSAVVKEIPLGEKRRLSELIRVHAPGDPPTGGRVVYSSRRVLSTVMFCGSKLVEYRLGGRREVVVVRDTMQAAPRELFSRGALSEEPTAACDDRTLVLVDSLRRNRTRIESHPLDHQ